MSALIRSANRPKSHVSNCCFKQYHRIQAPCLIILDPHNTPAEYVLLYPFLTWTNWGADDGTNMPLSTWLVRSRVRILLPEHFTFHYPGPTAPPELHDRYLVQGSIEIKKKHVTFHNIRQRSLEQSSLSFSGGLKIPFWRLSHRGSSVSLWRQLSLRGVGTRLTFMSNHSPCMPVAARQPGPPDGGILWIRRNQEGRTMARVAVKTRRILSLGLRHRGEAV